MQPSLRAWFIWELLITPVLQASVLALEAAGKRVPTVEMRPNSSGLLTTTPPNDFIIIFEKFDRVEKSSFFRRGSQSDRYVPVNYVYPLKKELKIQLNTQLKKQLTMHTHARRMCMHSLTRLK